MNDDPKSLLQKLDAWEALGLRDEDSILVVAATPMLVAPSEGGPAGRSIASVVALAFALLWQPESASPDAASWPDVPGVAPGAETGFRSSMEREGFVKLVGVDADVLPLAGRVEVVEGAGRGCTVYLDGAAPGSAARLLGPHGEVVVVAHGGTFQVFRVERAARTAPQRATAPFATAALEVPWEAFVHERSCAPWLREHVARTAASPMLVDRVGAAGALGRLWMPASADDRAALRRGGFVTPIDRVRAWALGLDPKVLRAVARPVEEALGEFQEALEALEASEDSARSARISRELGQRRDALESVAFVLRAAGREGSLPRDLRYLDEQVRSRLQWFVRDEAIRGDAVLRAVAVEQPLAWWGALALPEAT